MRGRYAYRFDLDAIGAARVRAERAPGVHLEGRTAYATHDAGPLVAQIAGVAFEPQRFELDALNTAKLRATKTWARAHQLTGGAWLARREVGMVCDRTRGGKTGTFIVGAESSPEAAPALIVAPALARLVWATQLRRFLGESVRTLVLFGRRGNCARWFNGVESWKRSRYLYDDDARAAILAADYVISNYDILTPQIEREDNGRKSARAGLPGWAPTLSELEFRIAGLDESHYIAGGARNDIGRRAAAALALRRAVRAHGLTATPLPSGNPKGLWGQWSALIGGELLGEKPFGWEAAYCGGAHVATDCGPVRGTIPVWKSPGPTKEQRPKLLLRMGEMILRRPSAVVMADAPEKTWETRWIEDPTGRASVAKIPPSKNRTTRALKAELPLKIERLLADLEETIPAGDKAVVFVKYHESFVALCAALAKHRTLRQHPLYTANGASGAPLGNDDRFAACAAFVAQRRGAVFIATIDSIPGMVSLAGASTVHNLEFHDDPEIQLQAENRCYEPGVEKITVYDYVVLGGYSEHQFLALEPKVKACRDNDDAEAFGGRAASMASRFPVNEDEVWSRIAAASLPQDDAEIAAWDPTKE